MNNKKFTTTDTALAAYLLSHDISLSMIDRSDPASIAFVFKETSDNGVIGELIFAWESSAPESKFYKSYRYLLRRIKESRSA